MEVVCLILGPMSASQPCSHPFWVLTSLHLLSFLLKMFFIILASIVFFWMIWIFFGKYWCKLYIIWNHTIINTLKFVHQWRSVFCIIYQLFMNWLSLTDDVYSLFHLQQFYKKSLCQPFNIPMLIILLYNGFNINNYYIHYCICSQILLLCSTFSFSGSVFWGYKCACAIKFHVARLMNTIRKMASNSRSNLCRRWDCLL